MVYDSLCPLYFATEQHKIPAAWKKRLPELFWAMQVSQHQLAQGRAKIFPTSTKGG
jgi:hypothetical protein